MTHLMRTLVSTFINTLYHWSDYIIYIACICLTMFCSYTTPLVNKSVIDLLTIFYIIAKKFHLTFFYHLKSISEHLENHSFLPSFFLILKCRPISVFLQSDLLSVSFLKLKSNSAIIKSLSKYFNGSVLQ